jgi:hypothetical protein
VYIEDTGGSSESEEKNLHVPSIIAVSVMLREFVYVGQQRVTVNTQSTESQYLVGKSSELQRTKNQDRLGELLSERGWDSQKVTKC